MRTTLGMLALVALLAACGSPEGGAGDVGDRTSYPDGPYGVKVGSTIENLSFVDADGQPFALNDIYANVKNRVMLLSAVAGWCVPCIEEQPKLAALHREYAKRGFTVVGALFEDANYNPATESLAKFWLEEHDLPYPLLVDAPNALKPFYNGTPPLNMIIDVDTMEILMINTGFDESRIRAVIEANLP